MKKQLSNFHPEMQMHEVIDWSRDHGSKTGEGREMITRGGREMITRG